MAKVPAEVAEKSKSDSLWVDMPVVGSKMAICDFCGKHFEVGHHKDDRQVLPRYKILVCNSCFRAEWHGIAPEFNERSLWISCH